MYRISKYLLAAGLAALPLMASAFSLTPGDVYASKGGGILQYNPDGHLVDTLVMPYESGVDAEFKGLAFGGDGLLYAVRSGYSSIDQQTHASVQAINGDGTVVRSYALDDRFAHFSRSIDIAFTPDGASFYVGGRGGLYHFDTNAESGRSISFMPADDIAVMPDGDVLTVSNYVLSRYQPDGSLVSQFDGTIEDPSRIAGPQNGNDDVVYLDGLNGVAFDAASNTIFVSISGYTGPGRDMRGAVLALESASATLTDFTKWWGANNLFFTDTGTLLISNMYDAPALFDRDLNKIRDFGSIQVDYVTAMPIPEPGTFCLGLVGLTALIVLRRTRTRAC